MFLKKIIMGFAMLAVAVSCASVRPSQSGDLDEYLKSENSRMKKRITSLERDNSVLDKENRKLAQENAQQYERIQGLGKEVETWKARHEQDLAQMQGRLDSLVLEKAVLEKQSTEKIQELTRLNEEEKARHKTEVQGLNAMSAQQAEAFDRERDALRSELTAKETVLSQQSQQLQAASRGAAEQARKIQALSRELEEKGVLVRKLEDETRSLRERLQAAETARVGNKAATGPAGANPTP